MKKIKLSSELCYIFGMLILVLGVVFMTKADLGLSMVVAPAYILSLKFDFLSFGMAEYCFQAALLLLMCLIIRKCRRGYLFSFISAFLYGTTLDLMLSLFSFLQAGDLLHRIVFFAFGQLISGLGIAFFYHTYIAPEVYELFVKEVSSHFRCDISKFKICYDCASCLLAIMLSFLFFGFGCFEGVKAGTIVSALTNGLCIMLFNKLIDRYCEIVDTFPLRRFFD